MLNDKKEPFCASECNLYDKYEFRGIRADEAEQAAQIEQVCFPPNEACKPEIMRERVKIFPETFLVAVSRETGKVVGFINGIATDEPHLRDDFYTDAALHEPNGSNVMILGVDVLPEYRKQGIAREMMRSYLCREKDKGRKMVVLTCLDDKVRMYKTFGFRDDGEADSSWGGEKWHEMCCALDISPTSGEPKKGRIHYRFSPIPASSFILSKVK